jgi:hypothetical protein
MKRILAMSKPNAVCAIHGATADGFFKGSKFSDFDFAELFSSAFFLSSSTKRQRGRGSIHFIPEF